MSEQQQVYDPSGDQEAELQLQRHWKSRQSKKQLKMLKFQERNPFQCNDEGYPSKMRRASLKNKQKSYYEESNFQVNEQKAKKYWSSVDHTYFKSLDHDEFWRLENSVSRINPGQSILESEYAHYQKLLPFTEAEVHPRFPELYEQHQGIKVVFKRTDKEGVLALFEPAIAQQQEPSKQGSSETDYLDLKLKVSTKIINTGLLECCHTLVQNDLESQITLWQMAENEAKMENSAMWTRLLARFTSMPDRKMILDQKQIDRIFERLYWLNILKLFIQGHRDKTSGIFDYYHISGDERNIEKTCDKSKGKSKKFQTDCKICFCSHNYESNMVVYCDHCNTSFHQICYGLKNIPKSQKYFCEVCVQYRLDKRKPECKLCEKTSFPMKKMGGYFYHVTCLVLNNLVEFRDVELRLRKGVSFKSMTKLVIDCQIGQSKCEFCSSINGMQFTCQTPGCSRSFHPICGYLNGCLFDIKRLQATDLDVKVYCNNHQSQRNTLEQIYFRRYVCDFRKTSRKDFGQFMQDYKSEMKKVEGRRSYTHYVPNLLAVTTLMKEAHSKMKNKILNIRTETSRLLRR